MFPFPKHLTTATVLAVTLGVSACSVAACSAPRETDTTLTADVPGSTQTSELQHLGEANPSMKTTRPEAPDQLHVTNIRVGTHPGFDRVVFDLTGGGEPGWFTDYVDTASQLGSGKPLDISSPVLLNVFIDGTIYPHETDLPAAKARTEGTGTINEILSAGSFEGRSQYVIGLNAPVDYSVTLLEDPKRLVIDFITD